MNKQQANIAIAQLETVNAYLGAALLRDQEEVHEQ